MLNKLFRGDPTPSIWWYTAWTRTKARFVRTYLGSLWIGLSNLLAVCVLGSVYRFIFNVDNFKYYFGYLGVGITVWGFISGAILSCSAVSKYKRSLNSDYSPFFSTGNNFPILFFNTASIPILLVLIVIGTINPLSLVGAILPFINLFLVVFFVSGVISLIGAKFKDIAQLVPVILQLIFLSSPIMFFKEAMGRAFIISKYNILYRSLSSVRTHYLMEIFHY